MHAAANIHVHRHILAFVICRLRGIDGMSDYPLTAGVSVLQHQVLDRIQTEAQCLLTNARQNLAARLEGLGFQDGPAKVLAIEQHLQQKACLNIHFGALSGVRMAGSTSSVGILHAISHGFSDRQFWWR